MHSQMKVVARGDEVTLVSRNGAKGLVWLLPIEVLLLGLLITRLAAELPTDGTIAVPVLAAVVLVGWTATQIRHDIRMTIDIVSRQARLVHVAPITGSRKAARFSLDEVECLALRQTGARAFGMPACNEYVVAIELRGGDRHVMSTRGPLFAYQDNVARFSRAPGLGIRIIRLAG